MKLYIWQWIAIPVVLINAFPNLCNHIAGTNSAPVPKHLTTLCCISIMRACVCVCVCVCVCRSFSKQRSTIERDYSQNMLRLVQQFMAKRDIKDPPEVSSMDRSENRFVQVSVTSLPVCHIH